MARIALCLPALPSHAAVHGALGRALDRDTATGRRVLDWASEPVADALVLGSDTEVILDDVVFGKPADATEAADMLRRGLA